LALNDTDAAKQARHIQSIRTRPGFKVSMGNSRVNRPGDVYDVHSLVEQFDAKPSEIRQLLRGDLDPRRSREILDEMHAAGLPT
jgi:hypothetical protein